LSISSFQDKVIKGGCGKAIMLSCVAAMAIGLGVTSCSKADTFQALDAKGNPEKPFAKIGGVELPKSWVDEAVEQQAAQMGGMQALDNYPADIKTQIYAQAVAGVVQQGYLYMLASQKGVKIDEKDLKKQLGFDSIASFKAKIRKQAEQMGMLKPGATDKDFDDLLKTQLGGQKLDDIFSQQVKELDESLKDPVKKSKVIVRVAGQLMVEKLRGEVQVTDEEIKTMFDTYEVKTILTKGDDRTKIDKAYSDLKAGKSFEELVDSVSEQDAMDPKKKKSENVIPVPGTSLDTPDYAPVGKLTAGNYSEPVKVAMGHVIYKLVSKKSAVPPDFEKEKAKYKTEFANNKLNKSLVKDMEKLQEDQKPSFEIKAYEAMYLYAKASSKQDQKAVEAEMTKAYEVAKSVSKSDADASMASSIEVMVMQRLYGTDKAKNRANYLAALEKAVDLDVKAWDKRKVLFGLYKEDKQGDKAFTQLTAAIDNNIKYDGLGQQVYSDISSSFQELKKDNMVKPEQIKEFEGKQKQWLDAKLSFDKQQEEIKKLQDAQAKKDAEAMKALEKNKKPADKK
jgi:hypothetical protein